MIVHIHVYPSHAQVSDGESNNVYTLARTNTCSMYTYCPDVHILIFI